MSNWLNIPELEARIKSVDVRRPSLFEVSELARSLAEALGRDVQLDVSSDGTVLKCNRDQQNAGWVTIRNGKYQYDEPMGPELLELKTASGEKVIWRLCGFAHTPTEWRAAAKRAVRDGYDSKLVPSKYFVPRATLWRWRLERVWPNFGRLVRKFANW